MILSLISLALIMIILLTCSFGPGFFSLINTGIKYGYKTGSILALGIVLSDLLVCLGICFVVYLGAINLLQSEKAQTFSGIIGGVILIIFGSFHYRKHVSSPETAIKISTPKASLVLLKGFLLNLFNPAVWFLWLGNVTAIGKIFDYSFIKMFLFFSVVLVGTLSVELTKVYLAGKIKKYLTDRLMTTVNFITGSALIFFGVYLIYRYYFSK